MKKHSVWNKVDIHIHSKKSNEVKDNDYQATEYTATELLQILSSEENQVSIFSITDHNCINEILYNDIATLVNTNQYKEKINYIIGVELDVCDANIHNQVFHCLCFFESRDIEKIKMVIDKVFDDKPLSERNIETNYPTISKIFSTFNFHGVQDIILIPHFNNKTKGLPTDIAIENLNYLCFNAYEDSNNIANINKSLKTYLDSGYNNFPFAVFSDCHDINNYPCENKEQFIPCYMLSNLNHPFNSLKTVFQEPRLRISLGNIENIRRPLIPENFINKILLNGESFYLSPYQNTIIGKFGSGKSLLLEKIKNGVSSLENHEKYSEFFSSSDNFKLVISDQQVDSVNEALSVNRNIKKYEFLQQEDYSFKSYLELNSAKNLFKRINVSYSFIEDKDFGFNKTSLVTKFNDLYANINANGTINNLNYEKAFSNEQYYSINLNDYETDYEEILEELETIKKNIDLLKTKKISEILIFTGEELHKIEDISNIVKNKIEIINHINNCEFENELTNLINNYNQEYVNNNSKQSKNTFINNIGTLLDSIKKFNTECITFENKYNEEIHFETIKPINKNLYDKYVISAKYNNIGEYKSAIKSITKEGNRKDKLFKSILNTIHKGDTFSQNKSHTEFSNVVDKYCTNVSELFKSSNVIYDILCNGESMLKKSAGEKSSMFIKLIFDLIENDLASNKNILLILDQPESNIDNDNIYNEISKKLREFKLNYYNFQSIIVTHNANVGITADSENIIIAKEILDNDNKKTFEYTSGCIEDKSFIAKVCDILEGGRNAMEQRTVKYGINIIKKVEQNEL